MANPVVTFSASEGVGWLTLDRPPANSYEISFVKDLSEAIDRAEEDSSVRVVILKSASDKFFCAGADIKVFSSNDAATNMEMVRSAHTTLGRMASSEKVFIAAINGFALGGGLEIALACDLRFAADGDYRLGLPEVHLGLLPGNGGTQRLPRLIGPNRALELMITGRTVPPREALELGFIDRIWPAQDLIEKTETFARQLAKGASVAIGAIKRLVQASASLTLSQGFELEVELMAELFETEDAREGIRAFAEKRKAAFRGR